MSSAKVMDPCTYHVPLFLYIVFLLMEVIRVHQNQMGWGAATHPPTTQACDGCAIDK